MYLDEEKKFIWFDSENDGPVRICEAVFIVKVEADLLSGKQKVFLKIYDKYHKIYKTVALDRKELSGNIAAKLCGVGVSISAEAAESIEQFVDFLFTTEESAEHIFTHKQLGFAEVNGRIGFLAHNPIWLNSREFHEEMATKPPEKMPEWCEAMSESVYSGSDKVKPRGTFRSWHKVIRREVIGRPKLELALALGAVAPVSHILRETGVIADVAMIALVGPSSVGKTSGMRVIASMYGVSKVGDGLITNMHSTINGLYGQLAENYGYPALFDEVTGTVGMDLTSVIYFMPNGRDKVRCNSDGSVREPVKFSGAIFFSSEKSLFESTINTDGLHARLVEFPFTWTASRQNAENLENELLSNCGTAVYPLLSWLFKRKKWLVQKYKEEYGLLREELVRQGMGSNNISNRVLKIYAQILVAAQAVRISLNLPLAIPEMRKLLIRNLKQNPVAEVNAEDEYDALKAFVLDDKTKFPPSTTHPALLNSVYGFTKLHHGVNEAWIRKDIFEKQLRKISNRDVKAIIKDLVKNGWLYQDSQRHRKFKYTIAGVEYEFYRLRLESKSSSTVKMNARRSPSPQLKSLLA